MEIDLQEPPRQEYEPQNSDSAPNSLLIVPPSTSHHVIVGTILSHLRPNDLKECRSVCRVWNQEACRALQKSSHVTFHEQNLLSDSFLQYHNQRERTDAPTPFKHFRVHLKYLRNPLLMETLQPFPNSITELYMTRAPSENSNDFQYDLHQLLSQNSSSLKKLRIVLRSHIDLRYHREDPDTDEFKPAPLHLPALQDFGYWERGFGIDKSSSIPFILDVLKAAPNLLKFSASCYDSQVLRKVLVDHRDWSRIEHFYAEAVKPLHISHLTNTAMPKLKKLNLHSDLADRDGNRRTSADRVPPATLCNLVGKFTSSLEELNMVWLSNNIDMEFPHMPHLTKLQVDGWDGSLGVFDPIKLPNLTTISMFEHHEQEDTILNPHPGVTKISLESSSGIGLESYYSEEEFDFLMLYLRTQYPNLQHLEVRMRNMTNGGVQAIIRHFAPTLRSLSIRSNSRLATQVFTGRNPLALTYYTEAGFDTREIAYFPSFRDMTALESLTLGLSDPMLYDEEEDFNLNNTVIQYGIGEMPSLKSLTCNWCPNLSVDIAATYFSLLEHLHVMNGADLQYREDVTNLQAQLPQTTF